MSLLPPAVRVVRAGGLTVWSSSEETEDDDDDGGAVFLTAGLMFDA